MALWILNRPAEHAIRPGTQSRDILALFEFFEPVAADHPVLRSALPMWHKELERRADERKARDEREASERLRRQAEQAARIQELNAITYRGPEAILRTLASASASKTWDFPSNWARIQDNTLRSLPRDLLKQALTPLLKHVATRCWRSVAHIIQGALKALERSETLAAMAEMPLADKLRATCSSRWSLTFYPESWEEQAPTFPAELRSLMLSKLTHLRRRGAWRAVRQAILLRP